MSPLLTIRSTAARVGAFAWLVFAALNLVDLAARGDDLTAVVMAVLLLFGCGLAYVLGLRPAIIGDEAGLTVRNPLRDVRASWRAVKAVEGRTAVTVRFADAAGGDLTVRAWVLQTSPRAQAKAERRAERDARHAPNAAAVKAVKGRTPTMYVAKQLNDLAEAHRSKSQDKTGSITWSIPAIAVLAVPLAALVALGIYGAIS
ncbi:PH domain-containing protein [Spirillospora sp. CA-294931]|uniref:PH domain-containing protein n=1 Tax=Spirillospora sp. CA-294931 TaxID=3240042 RepID=UPI003D8BE106